LASYDNQTNYRNVNASTNQSNHNVIDNYLLNQNRKHSTEGTSLNSNVNGYIPKVEVKARIEKKIEVAKETGWIDNDRYRNFLYKSAEAYDVDLRKFNGYN